MASKLTQRKSRLVVETGNTVYDRRKQREILMELKPDYMLLRLKGTRAQFILSYTSALTSRSAMTNSGDNWKRQKRRPLDERPFQFLDDG